jgi:hypothetical protein
VPEFEKEFEKEDRAFKDAVCELLGNQGVPDVIWLELVNNALTAASNYREAMRMAGEAGSEIVAEHWEQAAAEVNSGLSFLIQAINDYRTKIFENER